MLTLRAPKKCAQYFRERDPQSAITEAFIRKLIANGDVPCIMNGSKALVAVEHVEAFIADSLGGSGNRS